MMSLPSKSALYALFVILNFVQSSDASLILINDTFDGGYSNDTRFRNANIGDGSGDDWVARDSDSAWVISGGELSNSFVTKETQNLTSEGGIFQIATVNTSDTDLTKVSVSFDYTVGAGTTLYLHSTLFTGAVGILNARLTEDNGGYYDDFGVQFTSELNLKNGTDPTGIAGDALIALYGGALGTSGTFSQTYDISGFSGVSSLADVSHVGTYFTIDGGGPGTALSVDDLMVTSSVPKPSTVILLGICLGAFAWFRWPRKDSPCEVSP